jgi:Proteins containing SET domain
MKPLYSRKDSPTRGRHLVASQNISENELIFEERPLLSLQSIGNAHRGALCCRFCRAFVGGPDLALLVASGKLGRENVWDYYHEKQEEYRIRNVNDDFCKAVCRMHPCRNDCGEIFCSQECEEKHWSCGGHDLLCTGLIPDPEDRAEDGVDTDESMHPLLQFKVHAVRSNEILLMVADLVASVVSLRRKQIALNLQIKEHSCVEEVTLEELMEPYLDFTLVPWWEVATAPIISDPKNIQECIQLNLNLRELCRTSSKLLYDAFMAIECDDEFHNTLCLAMNECQEKYHLFSEEFFGKVIGSFEQNAIGIRARHPLCRDILENSELRIRRHREIVKCIELAEMIGDDDDDDEQRGDEGNADDTENVTSNNENILDNEADDNDYSVDDIASFLSGLYLEEQGMPVTREINSESNIDDCNDDGEQVGDDLDLLFTPLDGTCMFHITCKMNHSCTPNVIARYSYSCSGGGEFARWGQDFPLVVQCVAIKDILQGEELCISYINHDAPFEERQKELSHYGFKCNCEKCKRDEVASGEESMQSDDNMENIEFDIFGEADDESQSCEDENDDYTDDDVTNANNDVDGQQKLTLRVKELDQTLEKNKIALIPVSTLGPPLSFVNRIGSQIMNDPSWTDSLHEYIEVKQLLGDVIKELSNKNFCSLQKHAAYGEGLAMSLLKKAREWPHSVVREAHACFCVASAICYAQDGNFLPAMKLLDKTAIFGVPRETIDRFYQYVEYHSTKMSCSHNEICRVPRVCIYDYSLVNLQREVLQKGLVAPIKYPVQELSHTSITRESSFGSAPIVIRQYASEWPALLKWR